ncbi:tetratricopeptide repeat protein, partial [Prevotella falsenii]
MNKNDESLTEIKQFQNVPKLNSQDAIEFFNIGNICYNKEEYQNAIDAYSTAIRLD